jgi:hypothetical protein
MIRLFEKTLLNSFHFILLALSELQKKANNWLTSIGIVHCKNTFGEIQNAQAVVQNCHLFWVFVLGCAMSEAVICRPLTTKAWVHTSVHVEFVVNKGQVFLRVLWSSFVNISPTVALHTHMSLGGRNNRSVGGRSSETVSTHRHEQAHIFYLRLSLLLQLGGTNPTLDTTHLHHRPLGRTTALWPSSGTMVKYLLPLLRYLQFYIYNKIYMNKVFYSILV